MIINQQRRCCLALAALLSPVCSVANEANSALFQYTLEELLNVQVVTATKTQQSQSEVPAVVTVISAQEITRYGYRTLAEVLEHTAGFINLNDGLSDNFGVRGSHAGARGASRLLKIMVDGQSIGFRNNQQQWIGLEFVPLSIVERIEIVRGPVSVLYGANALLGAINVITHANFAQRHLNLEYEVGNDQRNTLVGQAAGFFETAQSHWLWSAQVGESDRSGLSLPQISPDYININDKTSETDQSSPRNIYLKGQSLDQDKDWSFNLMWQRLSSDNVFADVYPMQQPASHIALDNSFVRFKWNEHLSDNQLLSTQLSFAKGQVADDDQIRGASNDNYFERDLGFEAWTLNVEWQLNSDQTGSQLLLGFDWDLDREKLESIQRVNLNDGQRFQLTPRSHRRLTNRALYAQWQKSLNPGWRAILGARVDQHSVYQSQTSYRAGLVKLLSKKWQLKLVSGSSFQAPSSELLYRRAFQPGDIIGNSDLQPQKVNTIEAQLSSRLDRDWQANLTLFRNKVDRLVTYQQEFFNLVARNTQSSIDSGFEFEAKWNHFPWDSFLNLSYVNIERANNPLTLVPLAQRSEGELMPKLSGNIGISRSLIDRQLSLSWIAQYIGERPASTQNVLIANQEYHLAAYWNHQLSVQWQVDRKSRLKFKIGDLFDHGGVQPGFAGIDLPTPGRRFALTYQKEF